MSRPRTDRASVGFDDLTDDRQPNACTPGRARPRSVHPVEALPDGWKLVLGDLRPRVLDLAAHPLPYCLEADRHFAPVVGVAPGVLHEIADDLADGVRVGHQARQRCRVLDADGDVAAGELGRGDSHGALDDCREIPLRSSQWAREVDLSADVQRAVAIASPE